MKIAPKTALKQLGFFHAATYRQNDSGQFCSHTDAWPLRKLLRGEKVYVLTVIEKKTEILKYVGETTQKARPFQYLKNDIMKNVKGGIRDILVQGGEVKVWLCNDFSGLKAAVDSLTFRIGRHALEALLIETFSPTWNRRK
jgi:hypothetical protein